MAPESATGRSHCSSSASVPATCQSYALSPGPPRLRAEADGPAWLAQQRALEELTTQHMELREDFDVLVDCLKSSGLLTAREIAMRRRARLGAATCQELLRTSALVQHLSVAAGHQAMSSFAATCAVAASGLRSLLLLPGQARLQPGGASTSSMGEQEANDPVHNAASEGIVRKGRGFSSEGSSASTTTEGAPVLEDEVEGPSAGEDQSPGTFSPAESRDGTEGTLAVKELGGVPQQAAQRTLTTKLISGLLLGWRLRTEEIPEPFGRIALRLPGVLRTVARFAGCAAGRALSEAAGRPGSEVFLGGGLVRELAGQGQQIYICGGSCGAPADSVERFDPATGSWARMPRMQVPRRACAATSTGGRLFVMGGVDVATPLEEGQRPERLDPVTGTWTLLPPIGRQFTHAAAAACGGFVYVFGGLSCGSVLDQAQRFDPIQNVWEALDPMPTPRFECAAAATRSEIYVLGGANVCGDPLAAAESYSPATGRWQALPPLAAPRYGCAAAAVRGVVYVIGGHGFWESLSEAESYDPSSGHGWRPLPPMPTPRNRCGAAASGGLIYVFGGNSNGSDVLTVERFNPEASEWLDPAPSLPTARGHCIAAAVSS